jgi:hypothetical protein
VFPATALLGPAVTTSRNELPPVVLPGTRRFLPLRGVELLTPTFSFVLEASDLESSGGGLDLGGAMSKRRYRSSFRGVYPRAVSWICSNGSSSYRGTGESWSRCPSHLVNVTPMPLRARASCFSVPGRNEFLDSCLSPFAPLNPVATVQTKWKNTLGL